MMLPYRSLGKKLSIIESISRHFLLVASQHSRCCGKHYIVQ